MAKGTKQAKPTETKKGNPAPELVQDAEFEHEESIDSVEIEQANIPAPRATAVSRKDGFSEENRNGNKLFNEWWGRIEVRRHERTGKVIGKNFIPTEKKVKERKISQKEADDINYRAAQNAHREIAVMFLPEGVQAGRAIDVNDIVDFAWEAKD